MTERIIVTGGAGFIGSNLVDKLNKRGIDNIIVVDHLSHSEKWRNLNGLRFEDYIDKQEFLELVLHGKIDAPTAILHMGACSSTIETDADYLIRNNYRYTRSLCEWALSHKSRFIYASSAATYGDGSIGYSDKDELLPELRPLNMYGYSKQLFDLRALRHGLFDKVVGLKFFNVYGPREDHKGEMRSLIYKAYYQIRETGEITLFKSHRDDYADGKQTRDFIYIKDAVDVVLFFLDHPECNGIFNCGTGRARTWLDLADALFKAMRQKPNIRFIDMPDVLKKKYQYHTQADINKLRAAGYKAAFTDIEDGVDLTVNRHLVNSTD
jgi:ADP-L-glycero-D-manno-heptose 6-epimerase